MVCSPAAAPGPTFTLPVAKSILTLESEVPCWSIVTTLVSNPVRPPSISLESTFTS